MKGWSIQPQLRSWTKMPGLSWSARIFLIIRWLLRGLWTIQKEIKPRRRVGCLSGLTPTWLYESGHHGALHRALPGNPYPMAGAGGDINQRAVSVPHRLQGELPVAGRG